MAARIPVQAGDFNAWGTILNSYLSVTLASDGTLNLPVTIGSPDGFTGAPTSSVGLYMANSLVMSKGTNDGPPFSAASVVGGIAIRNTTEAAFLKGFLFRSPGGFLFESVPGEVITWRFIIADDGKANFGMANSTTLKPVSQLEVSGNLAVGAALASVTAAPTNGLQVQGNTLLNGDLNLAKAVPAITLDGTGVTSASIIWRTNGADRWFVRTPAASADLFFNDGVTDRLQLVSGGGIFFPGFGAGTGALSVGAADSGGAGFRLLRVPN